MRVCVRAKQASAARTRTRHATHRLWVGAQHLHQARWQRLRAPRCRLCQHARHAQEAARLAHVSREAQPRAQQRVAVVQVVPVVPVGLLQAQRAQRAQAHVAQLLARRGAAQLRVHVRRLLRGHEQLEAELAHVRDARG